MTRNVLVAAVVAVIMAGSVLVYTYLTPPVVSPMAGSPEGQRMAALRESGRGQGELG